MPNSSVRKLKKKWVREMRCHETLVHKRFIFAEVFSAPDSTRLSESRLPVLARATPVMHLQVVDIFYFNDWQKVPHELEQILTGNVREVNLTAKYRSAWTTATPFEDKWSDIDPMVHACETSMHVYAQTDQHCTTVKMRFTRSNSFNLS